MPDLTHRTGLRVGHKGADHLAPGNTIAAFDAALAHGCDLIEFDVIAHPETDELVLAHDHAIIRSRGAITLDEGLDHLSGPAFSRMSFDVDLKRAGFEQRVIDALRERDLEARTLISTMEIESLPIVRAASGTVKLGWSVPRIKRNYLAHRFTRPLALLTVALWRRTVPRAVAARMRAGEIDAVMSHFSLVTPHFVRTVRAAGGELYVWTVDDAAQIARFEAMGVTGVISNDPRLFVATAR